jgi:membrane protein DedA with SNARE-associated domain
MLQNLLLSILNIKKTLFCLTAFIGFSPIVFVSVFFGYQLNNFNSLKSIIFSDIFSLEFIIFIFFIFTLAFLKVFYKKKKN